MIRRVNAYALCLLAILGLSACASNPDLAIKIEKSPDDFVVLFGEFSGSVALIHGSPKDATLEATNGEKSCTGNSSTGKFSTDFAKNKVKHLFLINCSDGDTGTAILNLTAKPEGMGTKVTGIGTGNMKSGAKIKIIVGEMAGSISW